MRFLQRLLPALTVALAVWLFPAVSHATIAQPVVVSTAGGILLRNYIYNHIVLQALAAFWGISFFALVYYSVRMIVESNKDEAYTDMSNAVIYTLIGFGVIACALAFATVFTTTGLSGDAVTDVQPMVAKDSIDSARQFIITLATGIFVLLAVISGLRMISSRGDQGNFDKWRKVLVGSCMGVMIMFIANFIVMAVDGKDSMLIVEEMKGIALFLLTLAGFLCVLALIIAGIFLIISVDEGLRDRAKKTIIGTLIALAIVLCSYAVILTFVA